MKGEKELFKKYPNFFKMSNEDFQENELKPPIKTIGIECNDGWKNIIETAAEDIEKINKNNDVTICAVQIKEKFGGLRIYTDIIGEDSSVNYGTYKDIINTAKERSFKTCELCGSEGKLVSEGGWYKTRCSECVDMDDVEIIDMEEI